jgi:hypothetical protein
MVAPRQNISTFGRKSLFLIVILCPKIEQYSEFFLVLQHHRQQGYIVMPISASLVEAIMSREFRSICHFAS